LEVVQKYLDPTSLSGHAAREIKDVIGFAEENCSDVCFLASGTPDGGLPDAN
jgi:hypothetical protein